MKTEAFTQIVKNNEDTNVVTVFSMTQAFGKPLNAGSIVVLLDTELDDGFCVCILNRDNEASKTLSTTDYYGTCYVAPEEEEGGIPIK